MTLRLSKETLHKLNVNESNMIAAGQDSGCACCKSIKECCTGCGLCENSANPDCTPTKGFCNPTETAVECPFRR